MTTTLLLMLGLWTMTPDSWRPALPWIVAIMLAIAGALLVRHVLRLRVRDEIRTPAGAYRWRHGWPAAQFQRSLGTYLRLQGWHVVPKAEGTPDRVALVCAKDRQRLALLCVRPGQDASAADVTLLTTLCRDSGAARAGLVSRAPRALPSLPDEVLQLRFDNLRSLDAVLGGGW